MGRNQVYANGIHRTGCCHAFKCFEQRYIARLEAYTDDRLKEAAAHEKKVGIVGVHQQAFYLIALHNVMKRRFNDSPIKITDNCVIEFKTD